MVKAQHIIKNINTSFDSPKLQRKKRGSDQGYRDSNIEREEIPAWWSLGGCRGEKHISNKKKGRSSGKGLMTWVREGRICRNMSMQQTREIKRIRERKCGLDQELFNFTSRMTSIQPEEVKKTPGQGQSWRAAVPEAIAEQQKTESHMDGGTVNKDQ